MQSTFVQPTTNGVIRVTPKNRKYWLCLKALAPISHHDPGQSDKSNKSLFRRQAHLLELDDKGTFVPTQEQVSQLLSLLPVPIGIADTLQSATIDIFLASALLKEFIVSYGAGNGEGLFSGVERYKFLEERFSHAAIQSGNLLEMWGRACAALQVPSPDSNSSMAFLRLLAMPTVLAQMVIKAIATIPRPCVMLARLWVEQAKLQNESYAQAAGQEQIDTEMSVLHYSVDDIKPPSNKVTIDMPVVSSNTLRHQLIREPGMWYLYDALGVAFYQPAPSVTAMFYNGNDIKPGAKEPSGAFFISKKIRETYPLIGLISGSTDSFIIGEGNLNVFSWVRCKENNRTLAPVGLETDVSIFDLLDDWTLTRHSNRVETGQMPFSFETLVAGCEIVTCLSLSPYASDLEIGALFTALDTYQNTDSTVGGQSARGFGLMDIDFHLSEPETELQQQYEKYLEDNRDFLRDELLNGSLGSGRKVIT